LQNARAKLRKRIGIDKEKEKKMKRKGKGQRVVGIKALGRHGQFFVSPLRIFLFTTDNSFSHLIQFFIPRL
jgi:hypothetical protein